MIESSRNIDDDEVEEIIYQVKARPVLVTPQELENPFFSIPSDGTVPTLYTKQFDEGWLELRRTSSGKLKMVWLVYLGHCERYTDWRREI
jgi:hypothetical protein